MIPSRATLRLLALWTLLGLGASLAPRLLPWWKASGGILGALLGLDALGTWFPRALTAVRDVPATLALGRWRDVRLRLESAAPWPLRAEIFDHAPGGFQLRGLPASGLIPARGFLETGYRVRPASRGRFAFGPVQVRTRTPLGLWVRDRKLPAPLEARVHPDFRAVAAYALLATDQRLARLGILRRPRRGEGLDFHQLREYRQGDALRQIDWKASARTRKLISREYQDERDQQVVFLLDCGRRMRSRDDQDGVSLGHFDQALNALFLLAHVALRQGDAVGVATFAAGEDRSQAPRKGLSTLERLFQGLFDLQPTDRALDPLEAAGSFMRIHRKRSLVVFMTNLRDEEESTLLPALDLLRSRHLVLLANLRETAVDDTLRAPVPDFETALDHAAALDYLARRESLFRRLGARGVRIVDVVPARLPTALVNRYLELKASGLF